MITHTWQTQPWYPEIMSMLISDPILLPPVPNLITSPLQQHHPLHPSPPPWFQTQYCCPQFPIWSHLRCNSIIPFTPPWWKWTSWCDREQIDPMDATVEQIAGFLADRFQNESLEYSTLSVYRSAISAYHPSRDGYKIGEHPLIRDLMKGGFHARPPQPRYTETWDVDKVLALFNSWEDNDQLC